MFSCSLNLPDRVPLPAACRRQEIFYNQLSWISEQMQPQPHMVRKQAPHRVLTHPFIQYRKQNSEADYGNFGLFKDKQVMLVKTHVAAMVTQAEFKLLRIFIQTFIRMLSTNREFKLFASTAENVQMFMNRKNGNTNQKLLLTFLMNIIPVLLQSVLFPSRQKPKKLKKEKWSSTFSIITFFYLILTYIA